MTPPRTPSTPRRARRRVAAALTTIATLSGLAAGGALAAPTASAADLGFPFDDDFSSAAGGTLNGAARIVDGRLRLTDDVRSQAGSWSTDDTFPSTAGLEIEFDYAMYSDVAKTRADGLLLYLADGAAAPGVGAPGAGLGYTCANAATQGQGPCDDPGVPGGFAAVALDRYGNFSLPMNGSGPGATPDAVVVRGSGNGNDGYRFVTNAPAPGGVGSDGRTPRKVRVTLLPGAQGELFVTVRLQAGGALRTVFDHVPLHGAGQVPLPDTLRLGFAGATGSFSEVHEIDDLHVRQPTDLRVVHDMPPVIAGEHVAYTVTASNVGINDSAPSPLTVDVPDELHDVHWTCEPAAACADDSGTGDVATALDLPRGASATIRIEGTLDPAATGQIDSRAEIATAPHLADTDESDNVSVASAPVSVAAQLGTDKSVTPSTGVHPGDELEYTVTAANHGPALARQVTVVDDLPAPLTFVDSDDDCTADGQRVTCRASQDLAPGADAAFRFRTVLDPDYRGDGSDVVNVATAASPTDPDGGDPSPGVDIGVVDPQGPAPTATPTPTPTRHPTAGPTGGTGAANHTGAGSGGTGGALAYTGAEGLAGLGAVGAVLAVAGLSTWWWLRRRTRAADGGPSD
ncbi:hypothetical protein ACLBWP_08670 [Microbacterium sp. M1A1_1b]|uniref:hypothetical protein n=1 Tax=Curtobacterium sp. VKM Ac-2922 TaxID=2929475 RepID=UPI001FB55B88|nr:hypothetical protein [Curtobacterium sp. VKM Ac-2922]MCJ1713968.1 hypothetical protein [Curtobacterium sp. VKM Ac-2922]